MTYTFINPEFETPFYYCSFSGEKGFKLSNSPKDALRSNGKDLKEQLERLKNQSGGMRVEIVRLR